MNTVRLTLSSGITPADTSVVVLGDLTTLPLTGYLYFLEGNDFLYYTGVSGNTLTGVSDMILVHEAGEVLVDYYGILPSNLLAGFELTEDSDPDGIAATLLGILDGVAKEYMRFRRYLRSVKHPLFCDDSLIDDMVKGLGIDYRDLCSDEEKRRMLALWASYLLRYRGTAQAFNTLVYLTTGVSCTTRLLDQFVPMEMDSSYGILLAPAGYLPWGVNTLGLWYMEEGAGLSVANERDPLGLTAGALSGAGMWDTTLGCSLFDKHVNLEFSGPGDTLIIPADRGKKTYLGAKNSFSLQMIVKGKSGGAYPQTIAYKSGVFSVLRTAVDEIDIEVTNGVDTVSYRVSGVISNDHSTYLAILFNEDGLSVVKNYEVLLYNHYYGFNLNDIGSSIWCGDMANGYHGYVDMLKLGNGKEKVSDFLTWYEPLWYLLSSLTEEDLTTYFFSEYSVYNTVEVTLTDSTGKEGELDYIRSIAHTWLGAGDVIINPAGNMVLTADLGTI